VAQARVPKYIDGFGKSYVLLSDAASVDAAIVFVHGFGGSPTSTWANFHSLVSEYAPEYPWYVTFDLFFVSYDSLFSPIRFNAKRLNDFVRTVCEEEGKRDKEHPKSKYKDLILVGHSEGGVVIR
jgi:pimeloyl-ACP methyl ester carboxylesterase